MLQWSDNYSIGIPVLDEQHKKLFDIGGRAYELLKDEYLHDKYDKIIELIQELADYADYHFKSEEDYMKDVGYKQVFLQKVEHAEFMEKVRSVDLYKVDENQETYLKDILDLVLEWVSSHILGSDKELGEFVVRQQK